MKLRMILLSGLLACGLMTGCATHKKAAGTGGEKAIAAPVTPAASADGAWKWSMPGRNGQTNETTLKLKQEGDKLTGTVSGRNGTEIPIQEGQIKGDEVSFKVVRERNGQQFPATFQGKVTGDTLKGTITFERNGQPASRDWEAKRVQ